MKPDARPRDQPGDLLMGARFLTRAALQSQETIERRDGQEFPLAKADACPERDPSVTREQEFVGAAGAALTPFLHPVPTF